MWSAWQSFKSPPESQSLPYSISQMMHLQKNLKIEKAKSLLEWWFETQQGVAERFFQISQPHLEGWGLRGPSSVSFSSSLRWPSRTAAADHLYDWTGRATKILSHPKQNPGQRREMGTGFKWFQSRKPLCAVLIFDRSQLYFSSSLNLAGLVKHQ